MTQGLVLSGEIEQVPVEEYRAKNNYGLVYKTKTESAANTEQSYWSAFASRKLPTRLGATSTFYADKFLRQFDPNDTLYDKDPSFDPLQAFKQGGHSEDEMPTISKMNNWMEYYSYTGYKDWQDQSKQTIAESGFAGEAVNFIGDVLTDPTIYAGYGAVKMLSSGMAAAKALAIAGAAGSATTEAVEQVADYTEERTAAQSMIYIGAGATIGAVLGTAAPLYNKMISKAGKNYNDEAVAVVGKINDIEFDTAKNLSAAAVKKSPELSEVYGALPRFLAKGYGVFAPITRWQVASTDEARRAGAKFFGTTMVTKENMMGEATSSSLMDYDSLLNRKVSAIKDNMVSVARQLEKSGVRLDKDFFKRALIKINNFEDNLADDSAESLWARTELEAYSRIANEAEGMEDFALRQRYVATVYDEDAIAENFDSLVDRMKGMIEKEINSGSLQTKLNKLEQKFIQIDSALPNAEKLQAKIAGEMNELRRFINLGEDGIVKEAQKMASLFKSGDFSEAQLLFRDASKSMPSHFKERVLEQSDMIDFMKVDPFERFAIYARDVVPHIASHKAFNSATPDNFIKESVEKLKEKASQMPIGAERAKVEREAKKLELDLKNAWEDLSGATQIKMRDTLAEETYNGLKAAKNFTAALMLGASIFANLAEFGAAAIAHGLSRQKALVGAMKQMATSEALRNTSRAEAKYLANGVKAVTALRLSKEFSSEYIKSGMTRGLSDKIAKGASIVNQTMNVLNLNQSWSRFYRDMVLVTDQNAFKDSMELLLKGKISETRKVDLAKYGIDEYYAREILDLAKEYGEDVGGLFHFRTDKWPNSKAKDVLETALIRSNRATSIDPRIGDTPHIAQVTGFDLIFQFKSWSITAGHTFGLPTLQRMDADKMAGLAFYVGWSSLAYMFSEVAKGNKPPTDIDEILYAGATNSGLFGVMPDYGGHYFMNRWFDLESGGAKYTEYKDWSSIFTPAAANVGNDLFGVAKPFYTMLDPDKEAEFNNKFYRDAIDMLPVPIIKPAMKNVFFPTE